MGVSVVGSPGGQRRRRVGDDDGHRQTGQVSGQRREALEMIVGPAEFIATFGLREPGFPQTLAKRARSAPSRRVSCAS